MATFRVSLTAYFSDEIELEADSYEEAEQKAIGEFEDNWLPYTPTGGYTHTWDSVNVESVEEAE